MTITIDLQPDVEQGLLALAQAQGLSLTEYVQELVIREAQPPNAAVRTGQDLIDGSARVRGLLTDEEVDALFSRNSAPGRTIDLA